MRGGGEVQIGERGYHEERVYREGADREGGYIVQHC